MRKISSCLLIFVLLFNLFGYRFISDYIQDKNDRNLEARLDNNKYNEAQLIELKVPIHLAYQTTWSDFERYNGEVELKGKIYKYVKRKVVNDTLVLLCIPDQKKMELQTAKNDFFKNTNDLAQNSSKNSAGSKTISFKKVVSDYDDHSCPFNAISKFYYNTGYGYSKTVTSLVTLPHISPAQPPDFIGA